MSFRGDWISFLKTHLSNNIPKNCLKLVGIRIFVVLITVLRVSVTFVRLIHFAHNWSHIFTKVYCDSHCMKSPLDQAAQNSPGRRWMRWVLILSSTSRTHPLRCLLVSPCAPCHTQKAGWGSPGGSDGKESACNAGDWVGKIPWRREWQPTSVFLPGESHGQRSLVDHTPWITRSQTWLSDSQFHRQFIIFVFWFLMH